MRRRKSALQSSDMQHAAFGVYLIEFQSAGFRHAKAMPEHEQQQATVAAFVPAVMQSREYWQLKLAWTGEKSMGKEKRQSYNGESSPIYCSHRTYLYSAALALPCVCETILASESHLRCAICGQKSGKTRLSTLFSNTFLSQGVNPISRDCFRSASYGYKCPN